ncbi:nucleotide exchange factor GrpE [Haloferax sp. Atlit-10N]|uniref:nucleotide exchange factor GrpE n=1 Tax=Haloferax TaxID=2251 RepID=UPI000679C14A|nr:MULTISPECIES: nucleotide exchange factor GrpE [Haloferax]RDZ45437.1 nucleotide exchange factor GrpE [Haloferax sp. Atlit-19N]RDZ47288.1 nucleotide exchange factor GrpE [Haloferax sp. Atlit-16N]RDZ61122.1 nucleotide exchange factor GrpE [Haloferax sp. Atlit-10N]
MSDDPAESATDANAESEPDAAPDAAAQAAEDAATDAEGEASSGESAAADPDATGDGPAVSDRVAEYDDDLAAEVATLEARVADLEAERDDAEATAEELQSRLKRTQADFQNYKKRAKKRQDQIKERATEDFVERVVTVRDNLVRALDQDEDADIRGGLESTLKEFDRILEDENVEIIDPEPGTDVDPNRHEVMMRVDSNEPADTVADVFQPGYEMADKVIRAAQITVSKGE